MIALLVGIAFFSLAEIGMMAVNRIRLKTAAQQGNRGAKLALKLLARTDQLLGVILLGNTLLQTAAATLSTLIAQRIFGVGNDTAIGLSTALVAGAIIVFSEATPKVVAAAYPQTIAQWASFALSPLLKLCYPAVWGINLLVNGLMRLLRLDLRDGAHQTVVDPEELRTMVLESGHLIEKKHRSILLNLFELENITVDDVMTPRHQIESIDLDCPPDVLREHLTTAHHTRLPVYDGTPDNVIGVIHARKVLHLSQEELTSERLKEIAREPYFIPSGTPLFTQLSNFQSNRRRLGLVVDEYGEIQGLITIEDILEEIIGEFTTHAPGQGGQPQRQVDGSWLVEGGAILRELNRRLGLTLPLDGPKTLNGLVLEHFEGLPEPGTCLKIAGYPVEVLSTQERAVKVVRLRDRV